MQGGERGRAKVIRGETESAAGKRGGGRESASDNEVGLRVKTMTQESLKGESVWVKMMTIYIFSPLVAPSLSLSLPPLLYFAWVAENHSRAY